MSYHQRKVLNPDYDTAWGIWRVTTEGDCEGRTTKELGVWEGYIDEIALHLADRVMYGLCFDVAESKSSSSLPPAGKEVNISFGINSGTWNMSREERLAVFDNIIARSNRPVRVEESNYFACVTIQTDARTVQQRKADARAAVLARMTEEERELLGDEFGQTGC